ncbi:MAG: hypothetical protein ACPGGK_01320 [Pikeienuella sp.]
METKLVLVDGLPGIGKSTASQWISNQLNLNGYAARWHYEISSSSPLRQGVKASAVPNSGLFEHGVRTWENYVEAATDSDQLVVMDAGQFQHLILQAFVRDLPITKIEDYFQQVENITTVLNPLFIHLSTTDAASHIAQTYLHRGPKWTDILTEWSLASSFAKNRLLTGHSGSLLFWQEYHSLCSNLFEQSGMNKLKIDIQPGHPAWLQQEEQILDLLELRRAVSNTQFDENAVLGNYFCEQNSRQFQIIQRQGQLCAIGLLEPLERESTLIAVESQKLIVRGHDVTLVLGQESRNEPVFVSVESSWPKVAGDIFVRL